MQLWIHTCQSYGLANREWKPIKSCQTCIFEEELSREECGDKIINLEGLKMCDFRWFPSSWQRCSLLYFLGSLGSPMRHTLFEVFGLKSKSCKVWDSHFAVGLSCFAFAPSAAAFWAVSLCLFQFADLEAGRRSEGLLRDLSIPKGAGFPTWLEGT